MIKNQLARLGAVAVGMTFAFSVVLPSVGAQVTIAELQAQINALMAQLAALQGGSTTGSSVVFNTNLTVGSQGSDVTELQQMLVTKGFLQMPAGVSYGYFGPLTKAAVASWQAANGITPAVGYFGPISRAKANSTSGTTTTGGTTTGGTTTGGITTPGVEGTLTVTLNPTPASGTKVYEGDSKVSALGIKLEAKTSDIKVERVKIQLPSVTFYNEVASRIYIMDGSTVLASADLNSNTVVKESSNYFITLSGFGYVVPKDSTRVLTVALDIFNTVDSQYTDGDTFALTVPVDGVRGVDGAAINQFGPSTGNSFSRTVTPTASLADSATLAVSTSANTPVTQEVIAANGTNEDELDGLELLRFDLRSTKDDVLVTDAVVTFVRGGTTSTASSSVAYLYDGSTLVGSATVVGTSATAMTATFSDIDYTVPKDSTRTLTVKVDIDTAGSAYTTFVASVAATSGITAEKSNGTTLAETGSATGETIYVRNVGPQFSLVSSNVSYTAAQGGVSTATSTASATFVVNVKAVGGDIVFGTQSASSTFNIGTYKGSTLTGFVNSSTTNFTIPSSGVTTSGLLSTDAFKLAENQDVNVTVNVIFPGRLDTGALLSTDAYAFGVDGINWSTSASPYSLQSSTFMASKTSWRTSTVVMP